MANLKNKILQALKNGKNLDTILNDLSNYQENLLKNHSNPVFNNKDKSRILKQYTNLQNIGKSLYRYNSLKENNYNTEAQEEKNEIENKVLKGGIIYYRYVWHSEDDKKTCDVCKSLDGKVFDFYDEVPERPHPNCRCTVEVVEDTDIEAQEDDGTNKIPPQSQSQGWIMPCNGPITSPYGLRVHPVYKNEIFHNGWDIGVPIGSPVNAIADGKVIAVGQAAGYGNWVVIDHGIINGTRVTSEYGHISSWNVSHGQTVKQGQVIAKSGNAGTSTGPHVHITIREGIFQGTAVDPSNYIKINF